MDSSSKKENDSQTGLANSEISKVVEKHFEGFTALNPSAKCLNLLEAYRQHYLDENTYNKDGETVKEEFANWDEQLIAEVDWVHLVELCCAAKYMEMNDLNDICLNKILNMQKDVGEEECRKGFEMMAKWNPEMSKEDKECAEKAVKGLSL